MGDRARVPPSRCSTGCRRRSPVPCYDGRPGSAESPLEGWKAGQPLTFSGRALPSDDLGELTARLAEGYDLRDLLAVQQQTAWDPGLARGKFDCEGRVLRSPQLD